VVVTPEPSAVQVRIHTADGTAAARGRVGLGRRYAVMDQVETGPAHKRRGLGSVVMGTLAEAALAHGLTEATLLASHAGRALYETLGWTLITPFTAVSYGGRDRAQGAG
jgi:predicted GNAT family acetyltransferase